MMTLRRRLLLTLLPSLAVLMLLGGVADYLIASISARDAYDHALASSALALATCLRVDGGQLHFDPSLRAVVVASRTAPAEADLYRIVGPDGRLIAGDGALPAAAFSDNVSPVAFGNSLYAGHELRLATAQVSTAAGPALVTVAESQERRRRSQRVMLYGKFLVDFAELDITLLLVWIAVYYGVRPLEALRQQVESSSTWNISGARHLDDSQVPGELRSTVVSFNRMLGLLREAAAVQQRFVADAAHQLRTPLAGLSAQLELLVQDPQASTIAPRLQNLQEGIERLAHTANQLLSLMRADPMSAPHEKFSPVELAALVESLVVRNLERADERRIDLGADAEVTSVTGDAWLLEDLLGNLIDNALKYTPHGGRVTVRCGHSQGRALLEVEDNGPGIAVADRQRVKERFFRSPGSAGVGSGLGLAIVEEIARLHRADFTISAGAHDQGCLMRIRFPSPA
jgi:two-component system, OmpR family, sensor histidine kinase TctE